MKVLVSMYYFKSISLEGGGTFIDSIGTSFCDAGIRTTVIAPLNSDANKLYEIVNYIEPGLGSPFRNLAVYIRTVKKLAKECDAVYIHQNNPAVSFISDAIYSANKNTFVIFGSPLQKFFIHSKHTFTKQHISHWLVKNKIGTYFSSFKCRYYIVSTHFQKRELLSLGIPEGKIVVIPFGISPRYFKPYDKKKAREEFGLKSDKIISYLGHFSPVKGVPNLIMSFKDIAKRNDNVLLLIAWSGKGSETKKVLKLIEDHNLNKRVIILGKVDVRKYLSASDMMVLPYTHSAIPHFPLVMIESFAVGTPVISTNVGGLSEMIINNKTGILVLPNRVDQLTEAIQRLLDDEYLRQSISENIRKEFLEKYDSDVVVRQYLKLYEKN